MAHVFGIEQTNSVKLIMKIMTYLKKKLWTSQLFQSHQFQSQLFIQIFEVHENVMNFYRLLIMIDSHELSLFIDCDQQSW